MTSGKRTGHPTSRDEVKAEAAAVFESTRTRTRAEVAEDCGVSATQVAQWGEPGRKRPPSIADVRMLSDEQRLAIAQWIAGDGYVVVPVPVASSRATLSDIAAAHRETAEAVGTALEAAADGHITASEGSDLARKCDDGIVELAKLRELGLGAVRERVLGLVVGE